MAIISDAITKLRYLDDLPYLHFTRLSQNVVKGEDVAIELQNLPKLLIQPGRYFAFIGDETSGRAELVAFEHSSIVNDRVITATVKYNHLANEPVKITKVYKAALYQADTEDGTYTLVSSSTLDHLQPGGLFFPIDTLDQSKFFKIIWTGRFSGSDQDISTLDETSAFQIKNLGIFNYYDADVESVTAVAGKQYANVHPKRVWECVSLARGVVESSLKFAGYEVPLNPATEEVKSWVKNLAAAHLCRIEGDLDGYHRLGMYILDVLKMVRDGEYLLASPSSLSSSSGLDSSPKADDIRFAKISQKW
jgi:hypothetical protein